MFTYSGFLYTEMPGFFPIVLIKIILAVFEIFRKNEAKKHFFHSRLQYFDHTLYGIVKIMVEIIFLQIPDIPENFHFFST